MIIEAKDMNIKKSKLTITISKCAVAVIGAMCGLVYADIDPYDESSCIDSFSCKATSNLSRCRQ